LQRFTPFLICILPLIFLTLISIVRPYVPTHTKKKKKKKKQKKENSKRPGLGGGGGKEYKKTDDGGEEKEGLQAGDLGSTGDPV